MSKYPEHNKLAKVGVKSHAIGAFLDYGLAEQGLVLAEQNDRYSGRLRPISKSITSILARYFEIDQDKLDKEKGQMIDELAEMNRKLESKEK